jgi:hypothetical protein
MAPKFKELDKVRLIQKEFGNAEGYVIGSQVRGERWIYKISFPNPDDAKGLETYDNWIPEEWIEKTR